LACTMGNNCQFPPFIACEIALAAHIIAIKFLDKVSLSAMLCVYIFIHGRQSRMIAHSTYANYTLASLVVNHIRDFRAPHCTIFLFSGSRIIGHTSIIVSLLEKTPEGSNSSTY